MQTVSESHCHTSPIYGFIVTNKRSDRKTAKEQKLLPSMDGCKRHYIYGWDCSIEDTWTSSNNFKTETFAWKNLFDRDLGSRSQILFIQVRKLRVGIRSSSNDRKYLINKKFNIYYQKADVIHLIINQRLLQEPPGRFKKRRFLKLWYVFQSLLSLCESLSFWNHLKVYIGACISPRK